MNSGAPDVKSTENRGKFKRYIVAVQYNINRDSN